MRPGRRRDPRSIDSCWQRCSEVNQARRLVANEREYALICRWAMACLMISRRQKRCCSPSGARVSGCARSSKKCSGILLAGRRSAVRRADAAGTGGRRAGRSVCRRGAGRERHGSPSGGLASAVATVEHCRRTCHGSTSSSSHQNLSLLPGRAAPDQRGQKGAAGPGPGAVPGACDPATQIRLPGLGGRRYASASPGAADRGRIADRGHCGSGPGVQICRPLAAGFGRPRSTPARALS